MTNLNLTYLNQSVEEINAQISQLKEHLETTLKDTSIPLDERWSLFASAPDYLKNHKGWIVHFDCEKQFGSIDWYDDFYMDRYTTVDMVDFITQLGDYVEDDDFPRITAEFENALIEDVLQLNLGSFKYDW